MKFPDNWISPSNIIPPQTKFPHEYNLRGQVKLLLIKINIQTEFSFLTVTATQIDCVNFERFSEYVQWNFLQVIIDFISILMIRM